MVDAHFHIWQLARADYGWLKPELGPIYRDVDLAGWRTHSRMCGITAGVLVQAAPTAAETAFLLRCAEGADDVPCVVGWVDLAGADAVRQIEALARNPKLKGLRPMLQDIADPDWILQSAVQPGLRAMADCGLVFDALVRPVHLPRLLTLAARLPRLRIVVDHGAKPDLRLTPDDPQRLAWVHGLQTLARETPAVCKLSGLWTEAAPGAPVSAVSGAAHAMLDAFGPQRVMWGSDWPVLELAGSYAAWHACTHALVPDHAHAAVFGETARRVYGLERGLLPEALG